MGCCSPVGAHLRGQVLPDSSRARRSGAPPRASPSGAVRSRVERGDRPRDGAPPWGAWWVAAGFPWLEGRRPGCALASAPDTTGVGERGMAAQGNAGPWESHRSPGAHARRGGPGDQKPWRGRGAATGPRAPWGHHNPEKPARDRDASAKRSAPRGAGWRRSGAEDRCRWGSEAPATHRRAGAVGQSMRWQETGKRPRAPHP